MLQVAESALRLITRVSTFLAMLGMALLVVLISASIVTRFFAVSIPAVDDIASIILAGVFSFGLAAAVGANQHLSITILVDRLAEGPRWYLMRATEAVTIAVSAYLLIGIYHLFGSALRSGQKMLGALPIPRYLPMGFVVAGVGLFVLALSFVFIRNLLSRHAASREEPRHGS